MSYYEILFQTIENAINCEDFSKALELINEELKLPYVPKEYLEKLIKYKEQLPKEETSNTIDIDTIEEYLQANEEKQLIAVGTLCKMNLRDHIELCNKYLTSNGFINAKVLLIDGLIKQDIGDDISYSDEGIDYTFIPKFIMSPEESIGYKTAIKDLSEIFMKDPSMLELAKALVYKECIMALPINLEEEEGHELANKIHDYVYKAFNA